MPPVFCGASTIRFGGVATVSWSGCGGLLAVLRESNLITGFIELAGASGVGSPSGFSELFYVHENAHTALDYATRFKRIGSTGREGRLAVR